MSDMLHRNCIFGCCLQGSRAIEREAVRREIEMELADSDAAYIERLYWSAPERDDIGQRDLDGRVHSNWLETGRDDYHTETPGG